MIGASRMGRFALCCALATSALSVSIAREGSGVREQLQFSTPIIPETLAVDPAGDYIAAGGDEGSVAVWPLRRGAQPILFKAHPGEGTSSFVVLLGRPCVAVAGVLSVVGGSDSPLLTIAACGTGRIIDRIGSAPGDVGPLLNLIALPSCNLVIAQYERAMAVLDVRRRSLRPDLQRIVDPRLKVVGSSPVDDGCRFYGVAGPVIDRPDCRSLGALVEFDLGKVSRRVVGRIVDHATKRAFDSGVIDWIAVSPSRREVAVSLNNPSQIDPALPGRGMSEVQLFNLTDGSVRRRSWQGMDGMLAYFEYLDEDRIVSKTSRGAYVFDARFGGLTVLQSTLWNAAHMRVLKADPAHSLLVVGTDTTLHVTVADR